ncbi:MAG TPA: ATP-binding cassette domain-containing protein [Labilithrix sp.]|nr:ATP-binding cassette domain-containing protein [Labilithrix sp.]
MLRDAPHGPSVRPPGPPANDPSKPPPPRHVVKCLRKHLISAWVLVPLTVLEVAMDAGLTLSYRFLIDLAIVPHDHKVLVVILVILAGALVTTACATILRDHLASRFVARGVGVLRRLVHERVQMLSIDAIARHGAGDLVGRFSVDIGALELALASVVPGVLIPGLSVIVGTIVLFAVLSWPFALFGTLLLPLVLIGPRVFAPRAADAVDRKKASEAVLFGQLQEAVDGHRAVKVFGLYSILRARFLGVLGTAAHDGARATFLSSLVERSTVLSIFTIQVAAVAVGAFVAFRGAITVGLMVSALTIFWNLGWSLVVLSRAAPMVVSTLGAMRRIDELLEEGIDPIEVKGGTVLPPLTNMIHFEEVSFRYPNDGPVALLTVSLKIRAGQNVAFVGASGSGKSTALGLISRLYDPQGGKISFDGVDIRTADIRALRSQMAVVMQDSFMFEGTIRENIRLGRPDATDAEVEEAAIAAGIHHDIMTMASGYATRLGATGAALSGGQRQRIAIARALVRRPSVLLLDEASSALDPGTEAMLNETLARVGKGRTTISVTHRLQSVVQADRIYVFQSARVVEAGSHAELLARNGVYATLWRKQSGFDVSLDGAQAVVTVERLKEIAILAPLSDEQLEALSKQFICERAHAGQEVIRQGDSGDLFYVIARGTVAVTAAIDGNPPYELAKLRDGEQFGELALLYESPRSATVTALTECLFMTLTRERFSSLLAETPGLRAAVERVASNRAASLKSVSLRATLS